MNRPFCFFIMPFRPELHYFYLYLKRHIEDKHNIDCERGDEQILTKPLLEKIADYIRRSDVIIADCTGRNANVFYELGMAHAADKKVILLSQDDVAAAPADIRHFEFIEYSLSDDEKLIANIDNALRNVFAARYDSFYDIARVVFKKFSKETTVKVKEATRETFLLRISSYERTRGELPSVDDDYGMKEVVLPKIIEDASDIEVMSAITKWLSKFGAVKPP